MKQWEELDFELSSHERELKKTKRGIQNNAIVSPFWENLNQNISESEKISVIRKHSGKPLSPFYRIK